MRPLFRYVLLSLVVVTVFLMSAMTAMRFAIHGREVVIPKLMGLTGAEAERAAAASGLRFEVEDRFYSAEVPEGRILSQLPEPSTKVRRGSKIRVAESLGPQRVTIPSLLGQSERAAEINLVERGLQLGAVATVYLPDLPGDQVIAQSPPAHAQGVAEPKVNLLLTAVPEAKPMSYVMPDFIGRRFGEATAAIAEGGFKLGPVTVAFMPGSPLAQGKPAALKPIATDLIVTQSPPPGQKIAAGVAIGVGVVR